MIPVVGFGAAHGLVGLVVLLFFFCAFAAVIWWAFNRIAIPEPLKTIVLVILCLVGLLVLWQIVAGSGI